MRGPYDNRPAPARLALYCLRKHIDYDQTGDVTVRESPLRPGDDYLTTQTALYQRGELVGVAYASSGGRVHFREASSVRLRLVPGESEVVQ